MRTTKQHKCILMYAILASAVTTALSPGLATAAYGQNSQPPYQDQQGQSQYQDQGQSGESYPQQSTTSQDQGRDMRLEQRIAAAMRQEGYGAQGEIMILAAGNRVILLGTVPSQSQKNGAEQTAKQVAGGRSIDNRLHVAAQTKRMSDAQLESDVDNRLPGSLSQQVQVQAQNGTVTLQGHLDNWNQVADAIDAAFAAGAGQVSSQFAVGAAGSTAQGGAYPSYGYTAGQQGQPRTRQAPMAGQDQASTADLRLARQVASQLRQQLPPGQNVQPVQPQSIYVTVRQGTVTLHGYVQNSSDKQQAQQIVQSIQGVQNVRNDIIILSSRGPAGQGGNQGGWQGQTGTSGPSGWQGQGESQPQGSSGMGDQGMAGQNRRASMTAADRSLAQAVGQQLQNQFPDANINVTASQGTIILRGTVQDNSVKQDAEQAARSISGVQNVQNNLRVSSQGGSYQPQGYIAGQESQTAQGTSGQNQGGQSSSQMAGRQAGMSAADIALAQKIAQQLKQQLSGIQNVQVMRPGTIYVMAVQGTVILHGSVQDSNVRQQAAQIASAIPGVRNVTNTLRVSGAGGNYPSYGYIPGQDQQSQQGAGNQGMSGQNQNTPGSAQTQFIADSGQMSSSQADTALAQQVAQKLRQQLSGIQNVQVIRPGTIYVMVNKGTVTLDGFVPDSSSKQKAEQIAKSISGIQTVKNSLNISGAGTGGNQPLGYMPAEEDQSGNQMGANQQPGNQSGNQPYGNQQSDEDQSASDQPDDGM